MIDETTVYGKLASLSDLTDIVSQRIYPTMPSEGSAVPLVCFTLSKDDSLRALRGRTGTGTYTLTVDCYSVLFDNGLAMAQAVITGLDGWTGTVRRSMLVGGGSVPIPEGYCYRLTFNVIG